MTCILQVQPKSNQHLQLFCCCTYEHTLLYTCDDYTTQYNCDPPTPRQNSPATMQPQRKPTHHVIDRQQHVSFHHNIRISLLLSALFLRRHNPEVTVGRILLGSLRLSGTLLRDLAPTTRSRISGTTALGRGGSVDEALVRKPLAADELLGEVARIDGRAAAVDGFGDELGFSGEEDEVGDELLGCEGLC